MAQCIQCSKKGIFLKLNASNLCEACASSASKALKLEQEAKERELSARQGANIEAAGILDIVKSIQQTANLIIAFFDEGDCEESLCVEIADILQAASSEAGKAVEAVKSAKIEDLERIVTSARNRVDELHDESLAVMRKMI